MNKQLSTAEWLAVIGTLLSMSVGAVVWANSNFGSRDGLIRVANRTRALENGQTEIRVNLKFFMESKGVKYQEVRGDIEN